MRRDPLQTARTLYDVAAEQGGYFSAAQALAAGYTYRQQHYHRTRGNWILIQRGVYRLYDYPPGEREDLIRLSLWSRSRQGTPQATVSHETALMVHELSDIMSERIHLTVPPGFRKKAPAGCVLHVAHLPEDVIEVRAGYSVTTALRTLVDVAGGSLSQEHLNASVRQALARGLVRRSRLSNVRCPLAARERLDRALAIVVEGPEI